MPRPKSKAELLQQSAANYQRLPDYIEQFSAAQQNTAFIQGFMNRNIRDVLMHLHHWHLMFLTWYRSGMAGEKPDMPAPGYTWKMTPQLNQKIWEQSQNIPLKEAKKMLANSFEEVQSIIHQHTDKELFEKKKYKWTGSTSLGAYAVSATSSHYDWAYKLIKKAGVNKS